MKEKFVPDNFIVPEKLETDRFCLRMLSVEDVEKDYEAVMSSVEHLRSLSDPEDDNIWPEESMTIDENYEDLKRHQDEFLRREAFAYTVVTLDESMCLGCVYIYPSKTVEYDADVDLWTRQSELENGLDELLYQTVRDWLEVKWPFKSIAYPGREISWEVWREINPK
ncbi:hypothetical protein R9X47_03300 [Wukongibacter baidiensis]|uniref:hypothetical protein n=1 Tax=Wukongibacter baidiensis TaxID=1723361 RepID=UPI003D7F4E26